MSTSYQAEHLYHLWKTLNHTAARQRSDVILQDIKMYAYIAQILGSSPKFTTCIQIFVSASTEIQTMTTLLRKMHIEIVLCITQKYGFPCGSAGKESPAMQETWVRSLGWEGPLKKGKATHSSILAWRIPWTLQPMGSLSRTQLSDFHFHFGMHNLFESMAK